MNRDQLPPTTEEVLISVVIDAGTHWDLGEHCDDPDERPWWQVAKSIVPTAPDPNRRYRITAIYSGPLPGPEIVALESDGVGYGLTPAAIAELVRKDRVEDILARISRITYVSSWSHGMPDRARSLIASLPDPSQLPAGSSHAELVELLHELIALTIAHNWWPYELDTPDERRSLICPRPLDDPSVLPIDGRLQRLH